MSATTGVIETRIPARMDRLPWSRFHWLVVVGLGTVWILDGLEVTLVGNVASRLTEKGSGISITEGQIGTAAAIYVAGACTGALFFGRLTDIFGRKKLFILTLALYLAATVATAFATTPLWFYIARFFTGAGIGGEYAAINSAIDELIPARARGRVDLIINGSYWLGAAGGALLSLLFLNEGLFPADLGWRLAFGLGAVMGLVILLVRRAVPESPRWLFIHGRHEEAERLVDSIERQVREDTGEELPEPRKAIKVRQRETIPIREIAKTTFKLYPARSTLGLALFIGQAFIYNAVVFTFGLVLTNFYDVGSGKVGYYFAAFAIGNFLGPLLLGRLFDTVGRKPMISGCYLLSAALLVLTGLLARDDGLSEIGITGMFALTFFFASAGASAAYLTVSEIFPMETRALSIAFFFALGTAAGGIIGPLLFGRLIEQGGDAIITGYYIGAGVMALGGIAELVLGVKAEGRDLESIAKPLTAREAEQEETEEEERDDAPAKRTRHELLEGKQPRTEDTGGSERAAARAAREREGLRRFRPGPGTAGHSPLPGSPCAADDEELDHQIDRIAEVLASSGPLDRRTLQLQVGARRWGPGCFGRALREAVAEGAVTRIGRNVFGPGGDRTAAR